MRPILQSNGEPARSRPGARTIVAIVASILLAGIFLFAGIGKLIEAGQLPGQTEYLDRLIPDFLLTPQLAQFLVFVLVPYILPIAEVVIGLALIAGILIKLDAILLLLLSGTFVYHNAWMLSNGIDKFTDCTCFGFWETVFGVVSPAASLRIDLAMIALALIIIFVQPGSILVSQFWFRGRSWSRD